MTISLEHITPEDWGAVERMRQLLQLLVIDAGIDSTTKLPRSVGIRVGSQNLSFSASVTASATVTHGLGRAPVAVFATAASGSSALVNCTVGTVGASTFVLAGRYVDAVARTATEPAYWVVIG